MSTVSLEHFAKQFEKFDGKSVGEVIDALNNNKLSLFIPVDDKPDINLLIEKISTCLPHILEIIRNPYIVLKNEYVQTRMDKASALTPQGVKMTSNDSRGWKNKNGRFVPDYVYARSNEDDYNTYENRVVFALIEKVLHALYTPMNYTKNGVKSLYGEYFQATAVSKLDLIKLVDVKSFKNVSKQVFDNYKKLFYLRAKFSQCRESDFYKILSTCNRVTGEIHETNLFAHHPHYHECYMLWQYLEKLGVKKSSLPLEKLQSAYSSFISLAIVNFYVQDGFKIVKDYAFDKDADFALKNLLLENDSFKVNINANNYKVQIVVKCKKAGLQQKTLIGLATDYSRKFGKEYQYVCGLVRTDYNDRTLCILPSNENSIKDLKAIVKSTIFVLEANKNVYEKVCIVCGSTIVEDKEYYHKCENCGAVYSFLNDEKLWLNYFNSIQDENAK